MKGQRSGVVLASSVKGGGRLWFKIKTLWVPDFYKVL